MAQQNRHNQVAGFLHFECTLGPNEVIVIPVNRSASRNGDSRVSLQAKSGTKIAATVMHPTDVIRNIPQGQAYASTIAGEYPATPDAPAAFRWSVDESVAADWDILNFDKVATALRITAPATGTHFILYGDY